MRKKKTPDDTAVPVTDAATEAATESSEVPKYTIGQLRGHSFGLFGVTSSTYDAATNGLDKSVKYAVEEMREHLREYLGTKIFMKGDK